MIATVAAEYPGTSGTLKAVGNQLEFKIAT
jgi:hypothetical protein